MKFWRRTLFKSKDRFDPGVASQTPVQQGIRVYEHRDRDASLAIYKANEPGRFPEGHFEEFAAELEKPGRLWLVIEDREELVAVGGISLDKSQHSAAHLMFGMIHPDRHFQGFGTTLLFARLAALPCPDRWTTVYLSPVETSKTFYQRFGFADFGRIPSSNSGSDVEVLYSVLTRGAWDSMRDRLGRQLEGICVEKEVETDLRWPSA